jgi:uncharacterized protein YuzE
LLDNVVLEERGWMMDLIIRYDPEADVLVLKVREGALANEELLDNDVILGYDNEGKMVSVEIFDASKKGLFNALLELAKFRRDKVEHLLSKIG